MNQDRADTTTMQSHSDCIPQNVVYLENSSTDEWSTSDEDDEVSGAKLDSYPMPR